MAQVISSEEFNNLVEHIEGIAVVDFFATWCGPCKMLAFVLNDVEKALGDKVTILKLDFDKNKELVDQYEVKGYPTLILLKDGQEVKRMQGLQQKPAIIKMIEENL